MTSAKFRSSDCFRLYMGNLVAHHKSSPARSSFQEGGNEEISHKLKNSHVAYEKMNQKYLQNMYRLWVPTTRRVVHRHRTEWPACLIHQRAFSSDVNPPTEKTTPKESASKQVEEGEPSPKEQATVDNGTEPSNKIIFPWRHEDHLLPRLVEGTLEYTTHGQLLTSSKMNAGNTTLNALATAYMFLEVPLYQFLFFASWKAELADSVSWAFTQGVAGLLSNLSKGVCHPFLPCLTIAEKYQAYSLCLSVQPILSLTFFSYSLVVPIETIVSNNYELTFKHTLHPPTSEGSIESSEISSDTTSGLSFSMEKIMDEKLLSHYESAKGNLTNKTTMCLHTVPYAAELVSLYSLPYMSRKKAKTDKALLEFYRSMLNKPSMERSPDLNILRQEQLQKGIMESTVIAQVIVWCNEVFYIKDEETGEVLQGTDDHDTSRNVPHLVRIERTIRTAPDANGALKNFHDDWMITDIDDMLDGNLIV